MDFWNWLEVAAWTIAAGLMGWMLMDAFRVGRHYSEDLLLSSEEGHDELLREAAPGSTESNRP